MSAFALTTVDGRSVSLDESKIKSLAQSLAGSLVTPKDKDYDTTRAIWNAMIDRKPALIVRCANASDVVQAIRFAREHQLLVSVRGGGHNIAGFSVCEGGLMIDLSPMKAVTVDPQRRTAKAEPGALLGDFDKATQAHGLATPLGINSTTGIAGLTLGSGFGWLSRKYGLTIDNLIAADVVTADGRTLRASATENPDLFWGLRGGGGNFGVVTSFEYQLHQVGPEVLAGLIVHPQANARELLNEYRRFNAQAPDELTTWVVMRKAPPLPFLPQEVHGTDILVFATCYAGSVADGEKVVAPLRAIGKPIADVVGPMPFANWQAAFDPLLAPGVRNYWKSHNFAKLDDALIETILRYVGNLPSDASEAFIGQMGGATSRVARDATASQVRDAAYILNVHTRWDDKKDDARAMAWAREFFEATKPYAAEGVYVNFMPEDETDRVRSAYGRQYEKLVELKRVYDPQNLFRMNANIRPD
jgi:FAD/FMN-containing dehydrogenase